ncbi:hypothetical protein [Actinacidiphila sp. ITFR-21]|uniref:hypothetical protein n=1 Tax=Actinacidiphila sp. ITFR-21 TaxID=3075199 RepID=UPI00288B2620|nr:hypothetical protein [Streptomyces sp. ITFR-21]WNI16111.1 hypothetical protein RLT57_11600 [Streptomyces sp. ITFR-21]
MNAASAADCAVCHTEPLDRRAEGAALTRVGDRWVEVVGREGVAYALAARALEDLLLPAQRMVVRKRRRRLFGGFRLVVGISPLHPAGRQS